MKVRFIAQPHDNIQLWPILKKAMSKANAPKLVTIVSAFASLVTVFRLKEHLLALPKTKIKTKIRVIVGVDMGAPARKFSRSSPCGQRNLPPARRRSSCSRTKRAA